MDAFLDPHPGWISVGGRDHLRAGVWRATRWFLLYVVVAVGANALTGGNYFYQREKPVLPMLDQPFYLLVSVAASLTLFWLGYAVSRLIARRAAAQKGRVGAG